MTIYELSSGTYEKYEHNIVFTRLFINLNDALTAAKAEKDEWLGDLSYGVDEYRVEVRSITLKESEFFDDERLYHFLWKVDWLGTDRDKLAEKAVITESYR